MGLAAPEARQLLLGKGGQGIGEGGDGQRQQHLDSLRDGPRQRRRLNDAVIDNLQ